MGYSIRGDEHNFPYSFTHTHLFNSALSRTTQVSRYQKGKTSLDFTKARVSEWQWHQLGHMQVCTSLQADNHASTPPLSFYRPDALPAAQPTVSKHWRQKVLKGTSNWYQDISCSMQCLSSCQSGIVGSSYSQTCVGLGLQLVPRQKRSHHLQCTKLLLPVWQSSCADGTWRPAEVLLVSIYCWFVCPAHLYGHYAANIYT